MVHLKWSPPVILQTGFRVFFLGAVVYAVVSMIFWFIFYVAGGNIFVAMPLTVWHGYEMVFGFSMAVIAGFLLTAVTNWTGLPTASGVNLLMLFALWVMARFLAFMPASFPTWPKDMCDAAFMLWLIIIVTRPIMAVKQWGQFAVLSKLILVFGCVLVFFYAFNQADILVQKKTLHFAVYMIVSLIFTISRRVMPFFIERGVGYPVVLRNHKILDQVSLILLVLFSILDVSWPNPLFMIPICLALFAVHGVRLWGWYTPGIWQKPMLWVLFVGYMFLIVGFLLKGLGSIWPQFHDAALHAFTAGGIGVFSLGMMSRVSWGHTGRNIAHPPRWLGVMYSILIAGVFIRVFFPIVDEKHYVAYVALSQCFWIVSYGLFLIQYFPVFVSPRIDGKWG